MGAATKISFFEMNLYMRHMLLRDSDVASMAAPIEYRVLFLDHRMVEAVFSTPDSWEDAGPAAETAAARYCGRGSCARGSATRKARVHVSVGRMDGQGPAAQPGRGGRGERYGQMARSGIDASAPRRTWKQFLAGDRRVSPLQILAFIVIRDYSARFKLHAA